MRTEYIEAPRSYKSDEPVESPYLRAKDVWDRRIGTTVVQAKNWRLGFFISLPLSIGLLATNIYQLTRYEVIPFVVSVNTETGEPKILGKVLENAYTPREAEIKYFLSQFIQNVRSVPLDPVVIKKNWLNAYLFLKPEASNLLNDRTNSDEDSPLKRIGEETVTVKPISIVQVAGSNSYQIRWREVRYTKNGAPLEEYTMTGVFTIGLETPKDEETLTVNPLGIFIQNFQWNKEL